MSNPIAGKRHPARRTLVLKVTTCLVFAVWVLGQIFRDRFYLTGLCFYLPSPVVCALSTYTAVRLHRESRLFLVVAFVMSLSVSCSIVGREHNFWGAKSGSINTDHSETYRLLHWNIFRGHGGVEKLRLAATSVGADIYAFSEAPDEFTLRLRGFSEARFGNMLVVARGELESATRLTTMEGLRLHSVIWNSPSGRLLIFIADLDSTITMHRHPPLGQLVQRIADHQPDIVVGDFNAPRRSLALQNLPVGYMHAYEACGTGWSATWPVPLPLYAIDQCIVGPTVPAIRYELRSTWLSDHRQQFLEFVVKARPSLNP